MTARRWGRSRTLARTRFHPSDNSHGATSCRTEPTMLYLGIDQHARQITISLRDEHGDVLQARQVSTQPEKIQAFFQQLAGGRLPADESFVAVLEVCGFNDW